MLAVKNLSFAAVLSLGLVARRLAAEDEATDLASRGVELDADAELVARFTELELEERDEEDELEARDMPEEESLFARGAHPKPKPKPSPPLRPSPHGPSPPPAPRPRPPKHRRSLRART
ncbi:unnamed protein product [Clonostachys chloroleuca]|uniref:Uncharacterized protein n=1 Tax=Clonostachys chloroleuca TaxID=1926264 RepID=A0AA35LUH3_9HYPO|nr:unnamed protein product [Clonostachys chloroleuca]